MMDDDEIKKKKYEMANNNINNKYTLTFYQKR